MGQIGDGEALRTGDFLAGGHMVHGADQHGVYFLLECMFVQNMFHPVVVFAAGQDKFDFILGGEVRQVRPQVFFVLATAGGF